MNSLQFSPFEGEFFAILTFKGEFFAIFTFLRYFLGEKDKNYSCNGEFFKILIFILVIGVFLSGILRVCCFDFKRPFFFIFTFLGFFGMKMDKNFSCNGECFKILIFFQVILGYFIWNSAWVFFLDTIDLFLLFDSLTFFTL